ncbi:MAG TPA: hypothetical protein VG125_19570, partial [Pirellulales bacterium]|nr:hypothetical protein [Pirellulales bacterium]
TLSTGSRTAIANTYVPISSGITGSAGGGTLTIVTAGVYFGIMFARTEGTNDETDLAMDVNGIGNPFGFGVGLQFFGTGVQVPTHINIVTGNPDTYSTTTLEHVGASFGAQSLNVNDVITMDQKTFGSGGTYICNCFLLRIA